ncbi:MAG: hypothetical protein RAK18_04720 [Conexivisphaerales archaeon]|nr:hypothetical protein [Conexivisphaerales archaeon]
MSQYLKVRLLMLGLMIAFSVTLAVIGPSPAGGYLGGASST